MFTPLVLLSLLAPHDIDGAPFLATADPTTQFAMQLCLARVELVEMQTLYQAEHPLLEKQQRRVRATEQSLWALRDQGYPVDEKRVDAMLDTLLQRTKAELQVAQQELTCVPSSLGVTRTATAVARSCGRSTSTDRLKIGHGSVATAYS